MKMVADSKDFADELSLLSLPDRDVPPISDGDLAEKLQLQEALASSFLPLTAPSSSELDETSPEGGESSPDKLCSICSESKPPSVFFKSDNCSHSFCVACIREYVVLRIKENISTIKCPQYKCEGTISPSDCRHLAVPKQDADKWETMLVKSLILEESGGLCCPFEGCLTPLLNEEAVVGAAKCPGCRRPFCVRCKVAWHDGLDCSEFQTKGADRLLEDLAKKENWRGCPRCGIYVEKTGGCLHIVCRCSYEFCYGCRSKRSKCRGGCRRR